MTILSSLKTSQHISHIQSIILMFMSQPNTNYQIDEMAKSCILLTILIVCVILICFCGFMQDFVLFNVFIKDQWFFMVW